MDNNKIIKQSTILGLLISLNQGGAAWVGDRVDIAIKQYEQLLEKDLIPGLEE